MESRRPPQHHHHALGTLVLQLDGSTEITLAPCQFLACRMARFYLVRAFTSELCHCEHFGLACCSEQILFLRRCTQSRKPHPPHACS